MGRGGQAAAAEVTRIKPMEAPGASPSSLAAGAEPRHGSLPTGQLQPHLNQASRVSP